MPWRPVRPATVLAGTSLVFGLLWVLTLLWTTPDEAIAGWVARNLDGEAQARWRAASWPGATVTALSLGAVGVVACLLVRARRRALVVGTLTVLSSLAVTGLKLLFGRDRPEGAVLDTHAFPSGHAANATLAWGLLALVVLPAVARAWGWGPQPARFAGGVWVGIALMTAACRVLGGAHWTSDVLAGIAYGGALLAVARVASRPHPFHPPPAGEPVV